MKSSHFERAGTWTIDALPLRQPQPKGDGSVGRSTKRRASLTSWAASCSQGSWRPASPAVAGGCSRPSAFAPMARRRVRLIFGRDLVTEPVISWGGKSQPAGPGPTFALLRPQANRTTSGRALGGSPPSRGRIRRRGRQPRDGPGAPGGAASPCYIARSRVSWPFPAVPRRCADDGPRVWSK